MMQNDLSWFETESMIINIVLKCLYNLEQLCNNHFGAVNPCTTLTAHIHFLMGIKTVQDMRYVEVCCGLLSPQSVDPPDCVTTANFL